ncbi:hypothetical protein M409DRAFT_18806 [Zasmidium cellare ATCC 36951]|uniref:Enoyl reductase (ER) domain-containing protein n=1 Tax=Zasmidium cellare ATCC 36951 TaxID=1080233 RepID=A0A6A6CVU6_ZASCE|nr:uncharacterized protein M409DRAFT_18806 [Zasmidium cellare ATCC 36951]KAF2170833.1 hypothetical protein M409DRAFT_18806 [Zasmidium cellare ATCC 36951]
MSKTLPAKAAWLRKGKAPLEVGEATYTPPGEGEIVIKNAAVAVNPLDHFKRDAGGFAFGWIKLPFIMGSDAAGEVVEVGSNVNRFKIGDRATGQAVGMDRRSNKSSEGAFQTYTVLREVVSSPIPDTISYEQACVLPLGLSTASCGLFDKDFLALQAPTLDPKPTGKTVLIWGGSSSVGCNAIQLARAAGYKVISTASPSNHALLRQLGASEVFDYKSPTVVADIVKTLQSHTVAGAFAIGDYSTEACISILGKCKGRRFIAQASVTLPEGGFPSSLPGMVPFGATMTYRGVCSMLKAKQNGVSMKFIWGSDPAWNELGPMIYQDFLPRALAEKKFVPAPEPMVVGIGLEYVQEGLEVNKKGVSAKKVVIKL